MACAIAAACARPGGAPPPAPLPQTSGTIEVHGLGAPVRIVRDRWGVAHISAENTHDLFFAQGFVQAQDRLFQIDWWRRAASGELAAVLGANFIERDAMTRRMQPATLREDGGAADWEVLGAETRAIAEAFTAGINAWVARSLAHPPDEFRLAGWSPAFWRPEDLLRRTDAFAGAANADTEILRAAIVAEAGAARAAALMPLDPPVALRVPAGLDPALVDLGVTDALRRVGTSPFFTSFAAPFAPAASNAWAVSGARSASGRPLVAADPHEPFLHPSRHYLVHLKAPGWNVIGATEPWAPGVAIGHNEAVAWGATAFAADVQDLYVERTSADHPAQVRGADGWTPVQHSRRTLQVKGRHEPFEYDHDTTRDGVVVAVDSSRELAYVLRWSALEPGAAPVLAALAIDRAGSVDEFRRQLAGWKTPVRLFIVADRSGRIASQAAGLVPVRRNWNGTLPVPGWTGSYEWSGWQSLDSLPHTIDPRGGVIATANERPPTLGVGDVIGFNWSAPARVERIRQLLTRERPLTLDDMADVQQDVEAWHAWALVPLLEPLRAEAPEVEQARLALLGWDRRVAADSETASIYVAWEDALTRLLIAPHLGRRLAEAWVAEVGEPGNVVVPAIVDPSREWFGDPPAPARDRLLLEALARALEDVRAASGGRVKPWGDLHAVLFEHPLAITASARERYNIGPFRLAGYRHTVAASGGRGFAADWGAPFRILFDLGDWDRGRVGNAPGQSEWPGSPHFADLAALQGGEVPLLFTDVAVAAAAVDTLELR